MIFAAGLAAGYILGTRAGHDKYEQIVQGAKNVSEHPTVARAQMKIKDAVAGATDAATTKLKLNTSDASGPSYTNDADSVPYGSTTTETVTASY